MPRVFEIALHDANAEDFHLRIDNEVDENGNPVPHRVDTTGTDRQGKAALMTVKGRMPTVVHGFEKSGSTVPYTLVVFEWFTHRNTNDKQFREVTIEVAFEAHGKRGEAEPEAQRLRSRNVPKTHWDPEVVGLAPFATSWYQRSTHQITNTSSGAISTNVGFAPYLSIVPKFSWEKSDSHAVTKAVQVTGEFAFLGKQTRSKANGARFIMLENPSQHTGVPAYLRTAVLLRRQHRDNGQFLARVDVSYRVSPLQDFRERWWKVMGRLPVDQPIVFDPRVPTAPCPLHAFANNLAAAPIAAEFTLASIESEDTTKDGSDPAGKSDPADESDTMVGLDLEDSTSTKDFS